MSSATRNEGLPNGSIADRWDASADDESTPRSSSIDDNPDESIEVPFHGSCPKCHHLHTNSPFTIYQNLTTKHSRFQCDACKHHILGIGRASTQTTLASVESIPVQPNRHSVISRPSNLQICINAPPPPTADPPTILDQINIPEQLSTIAEANTLNGRSRSPSWRQAPSPQRGISPSSRASPRDNGALAQEESREGGESPARSHSRSRLRVLFRRGKARLLSESGELKILGFNIKITRARPKDRQGSNIKTPRPHDPVQGSTTDGRITPVRRGADEVQNPGRSAPNSPSPVADSPEEPAGPSSAVVHDEVRPTNPQQSEYGEGQDHTASSAEAVADVEGDLRAARDKKEKIRARRREATLKSEAVRKPYCHCRVGCPCLGDGAESDGSTESHVTPFSLPVSEVPDHPIHAFVADPSRSSSSQTSHGNARFLSEIGSHVNFSQVYPYRRISLAENLSTGADSNRRQGNRLSQDTTTWGSNDSSTSLTARRPSPGPSSAMGVPSHRSSGRIAVQNYEDQSRYHGPSRARESMELPTRESEVVPNTPNPGVNDETTTGRVNMLNVGPEQEGRQQLSDGTSISPDDTLEQPENQERTPRPQSHNAAADNAPNAISGPSPEVLSTALAHLAGRQMNDLPSA